MGQNGYYPPSYQLTKNIFWEIPSCSGEKILIFAARRDFYDMKNHLSLILKAMWQTCFFTRSQIPTASIRRFSIIGCCLLLLCMSLTANAKRRERRSVVLIETTAGNIRVALSDDTPMHRNNFLRLVSQGYYDGTLFHRVIENFMIQGGDPKSKGAAPGILLGDGEPGYRIPAEFDLPFLYHWRGALAAARESDEYNPEQESSGSQFYIVWGKKQTASDIRKVENMLREKGIKLTSHMIDEYVSRGGTPHLDGQYTVFGEVIEGLEVVEKIQGVKTDKNDRPIEDVKVIRMTVEQLSSKAKRPTRRAR